MFCQIMQSRVVTEEWRDSKPRNLHVATTWYPPTLKSSLTRPKPIPREAPVTRTTLPVISNLQQFWLRSVGLEVHFWRGYHWFWRYEPFPSYSGIIQARISLWIWVTDSFMIVQYIWIIESFLAKWKLENNAHSHKRQCLATSRITECTPSSASASK